MAQEIKAGFPGGIFQIQRHDLSLKCLAKEGENANALISRIREAIDRLREYHGALVSAATTG